MIKRILPKSVIIKWLQNYNRDYITPLLMQMVFMQYGQDMEIEEEIKEDEES